MDVVQRADVALYHGKAAGRNRVETSPAPLAEAHWPA
jgi:PleD family two-component response regulator